MPIKSGHYHITNVEQKNLALLPDANDRTPLQASDKQDIPGEQWHVKIRSNGYHSIVNAGYDKRFANCGIRAGVDTTVEGDNRDQQWFIQETRVKGHYTISTTDTEMFWALLDNQQGTPVTLYDIPSDSRSWWTFTDPETGLGAEIYVRPLVNVPHTDPQMGSHSSGHRPVGPFLSRSSFSSDVLIHPGWSNITTENVNVGHDFANVDSEYQPIAKRDSVVAQLEITGWSTIKDHIGQRFRIGGLDLRLNEANIVVLESAEWRPQVTGFQEFFFRFLDITGNIVLLFNARGWSRNIVMNTRPSNGEWAREEIVWHLYHFKANSTNTIAIVNNLDNFEIFINKVFLYKFAKRFTTDVTRIEYWYRGNPMLSDSLLMKVHDSLSQYTI